MNTTEEKENFDRLTYQIKSRRMGWAERVARMGEMRNAYKLWSQKPDGRDHSEDRSIDGSVILYLVLGK
jgi:hypothetical protein